MIKILFLIHDLGQGGAEKVLVNLVNNMDRTKFDISVTVLFGGGVNEQFLKPDIKFHAVWPKEIPGNSTLMKLMTPEQLHKICVKENYDIEISYLEGPSARVISGCSDPHLKLISWIHSKQSTLDDLASPFRSKKEAINCYEKFNQTVFVSKGIQDAFTSIMSLNMPYAVLYNTVESNRILHQASIEPDNWDKTNIKKIVAVGTLKEVKGYDRLLRIIQKLKKEGIQVRLFILGKGPLKQELEKYINENNLQDNVMLLGYHTNPYQYVARCDLFVCSSYSEGFSTAATEALIVGTPVCTVDVPGMKEMLGENNEYGIVTKNSEEALYRGIKQLITNPDQLEYYRKMALKRGKDFDTKSTVTAVENLFEEVVKR